MDITVKAKNCEVPVRLKEDAVSKVAHATRFYARLEDIEMVFSEDHNPRIADSAHVELTARTKRHQIRALGSAGDHRGAVDIAVERFERQLARYKARLIDRSRKRKRALRGRAQIDLGSAAPAGEQDGWPTPRIVRTEQMDLVRLRPEEAAVQLELLDRDFLLFTSADTGRCNLIHRLRDGGLGVIEAV